MFKGSDLSIHLGQDLTSWQFCKTIGSTLAYILKYRLLKHIKIIMLYNELTRHEDINWRRVIKATEGATGHPICISAHQYHNFGQNTNCDCTHICFFTIGDSRVDRLCKKCHQTIDLNITRTMSLLVEIIAFDISLHHLIVLGWTVTEQWVIQ